MAGDALFVDPAKGDYRVKDGSPALALGFKNFPMDRFGVQKPALRALARTPILPSAAAAAPASERSHAVVTWLGAKIKNLAGLDEISAAGMYEETGVRVVEVPPDSAAAKAGLKPNNVILSCNGQPTDTVEALLAACQAAAGKGKIKLEVWRQGQRQIVELNQGP